jgi:hypothetical protein
VVLVRKRQRPGVKRLNPLGVEVMRGVGLSETRRFKVTATVRVWKTVEYLVDADSFDEARDNICNGYWDDIYDESEDDSDVDSIDYIECWECDSDEDDCECEHSSNDVLAELGL